MKKWQKTFLTVSSLLVISAGCMSGCGNSPQTDTSEQPSESSVTESSVAESSVVSELSSQPSETSTSSKAEESSKEESKAENNPAVQEIKILNDFKKNIPSEQDLVYQVKWKNTVNDKVTVSEERPAKLYFVDAVIRDINNDGHYEMIVKYDGRGKALGGNNRITYKGKEVFIDYIGKLIYDIVTVKDGKAVSSGHYENEEGWFDHGGVK
ncbi:MAG: hypothetical protein PUG48_06185 [Clostridia bacterium]|nr:hypothetical protein [Clostridia bacterium]